MNDTKPDLVELSSVHALVTGASGRVGQRVAAALLAAGAIVRTVSIPGDPGRANIPAGVDIIEGSLSDRDVVVAATDGIDVLVHLAALMDWSADANDLLFQSNVTGTYLLLDALSARPDEIKRIVLASSDEVYPALNMTEVITESNNLEPYSFYGLTKQLDEVLGDFYARAHKLPITVARFSLTAAAEEISRYNGWSGRLFFGAGIRNLMVGLGRTDAVQAIDAEITDPEHTLILPFDTDGQPFVFQFCDVRDLVHGLMRLIQAPGAVGNTFNLSGPVAADYSIVIPALSEKLGIPYVRVTIPGERFNVRTSIELAKSLVDYQPVHDPLSIIAELPTVAVGVE
jgi:UDP-glucose 4-epimerase